MTLLSAWSILMARLSGQSDIVTGSPVANRQHIELEPLIGFFINALALRVQLKNDLTVSELLDLVKESTLNAHKHQDMPFEQIVEFINPERNTSYSPIFQVWFNLDNSPNQGKLKLPNLRVSGMELTQETTQFDLTLSLQTIQNKLVGSLEFSQDLFELSTAQRFVRYFINILNRMVDDPNLRVCEIDLLDSTEKQLIEIEFNNTASFLNTEKLIQQLFEEQVEKNPDANAVFFDNQIITYAELNAKANQLAHFLRAKEVGADTLVGLYISRSLEMIVGILGILKAGGAYVPIDPDYPQERISYILRDTGTTIVLTSIEFTNNLLNFALDIVYLDKDWSQIEKQDSTNPEVNLSSDNLAYAIYTSGSTGNPKGVLVSHRNVVHSTMARIKSYKEILIGYLLLSSFAFDSSVAGIFWTLGQGGCLYLPTQDSIKDPNILSELVKLYRISHLLALPSLYALILERSYLKLNSLKTVIVAGESCPVTLVDNHYSKLPQVALYNEYGPTENTVWSSYYLTSKSDVVGHLVPIGCPIENVKIYILNKAYLSVPIGVKGEVYIGGEGLVRGYLNSPELTSEKFIPDPFGSSGERLYKTGDLARYHMNGDIEFLGRIDNQIKLRGYRIELGEIEAQLIKCQGVKEALVLVREDNPGDKRLIAYLIAVSGYELSVDDLRHQLSTILADYMLPSAYVFLDKFPLTPNGKLDRKSLPAPENNIVVDLFEVPQNEIEQVIADIWQEVFNLNTVSRYDNFFELGGHSLLAIEMISRLSDKYQIDLPIIFVFQAATVKELAEKIEIALWAGEYRGVLETISDIESGEI